MSKQRNQRPTPAAAPAKKKPVAKQSAPVVTKRPSLPGGWIIGLAAAAFGFLLYINTFGHTYCLDDFSAIKENWVVKGGLKNLGTIFSTEYRYGAWSSPGSLYRPLTLAMFSLEYQIAPDQPYLSHVMNVLFYALTGWALWVTWRKILVAYPPAMVAMGVLLFMAHPVHTEVVANIKSRDEILSLLCCTLALNMLWRYLEEKKTSQIVIAMTLFALGLFSKESSFLFLFIFPITIAFFSPASFSENLRASAPMAIPAALFLLVRHQVLASQPYNEIYSILDNFIIGATNPAERLASAFSSCWRYLQVLLWPIPLVCDQGYPQLKPVNFSDWRAVLGVLAFFGMGIWALLNLKRKHFLAFSILFFLFPFALFSNVLFLIGTSYGERLLYVPSLGFAFATAWAICKICQVNDLSNVWKPNGNTMPWTVAGLIIVAYGGLTITRNPAWFDSASLYAADLPNSPNCAKLNYHNALEVTKGGIDEKRGVVTDSAQVWKGVEAYTKTISLYPEYHDAYGSRGLAYFRLQKYDLAFEDYQKALKYRPNDAKVLSNLGFIYFMRNQLDKSEEVYRKSIQYDPRFVDARRNLGAVLAMKKDFPAAIEQWKVALQYEPRNATLLYYIGSGYRDMGKADEAAPWLEQAYAIEPSLRK
ncbi:MAG: tetratricopeptide repeat protein [Saprospiraceae bacterium]